MLVDLLSPIAAGKWCKHLELTLALWSTDYLNRTKDI